MQSRFLHPDAGGADASLQARMEEMDTRLSDLESRLAALDGGLG